MATVEPQAACLLQPVPITSVQPGGGLCMWLELAWGRWRRWLLRTFRPGYVQQMAAKRQGACPNCPHDIVDARDLKYYRNVCGFWFHDADDPFRWREQLGLTRLGLVELLLVSGFFLLLTSFFLGLAVLLHPLWGLPLLVVLPLWGLIVAFFRDPQRVIPDDPHALVSPADGTVTHIDEVADPDFPGGRAFRISIFLSVFNVHVNRVPCSGKVVDIRYFPGQFLDARHAQCGVANEQLWLDLEEEGTSRKLRIKQISGKLARRIVCWLKRGEEVKRGQRFGMIKFGSRTEVYLPADTVREVQVKVGDTVRGGSSVLLRYSAHP